MIPCGIEDGDSRKKAYTRDFTCKLTFNRLYEVNISCTRITQYAHDSGDSYAILFLCLHIEDFFSYVCFSSKDTPLTELC